MIYLEYDARRGHAYADGDCDEEVRCWIEDHQDGVGRSTADNPIMFSTENIFYAVRVAVKQGRIDCTDVQVEFNGQLIRVYPSGGATPWPDGFCDYAEKQTMELL